MKRIISLIVIISFILLTNTRGAYSISKKWYSLPLLGISVLGGYASNYLYKLTKEKYDEADEKFAEYMALKNEPNEVFERTYEEYEDKFAEAEQMKSYYYIALGATIISFGASIYFLFSTDKQSSTALGYRYDFYANRNDLYLIKRF